MLEYEASTTIDAPASVVWDVLVDGPGYARWDNGVERVEGTIADGERIRVFSEVQPGRAFPVRVGEWRPAEGMTWTGGMPLGLFRGVRTFTLTEREGTTTVRIREAFTGPLLGLVSRSMPDLQPSFDAFVAGLKAEAESRTA